MAEEDDDLRGWVDPKDRLWRHPSELAPTTRQVPSSLRARSRRHPTWAASLVSVGAAAVVITGLVMLINTGSGGVPSGFTATTTSTIAARAGCCEEVPPVARDAEQSIVMLESTTSRGFESGCGVVAAPGGWIITTYDAVAGATTTTAVTVSGRRLPALVVSEDPRSDVAIVRVDGDLPPAHFAADATLSVGLRVVLVALGATPVSPETVWSPGTVTAESAVVAGGSASGMAAIGAVATSRRSMAGELLMEPQGDVAGLLDSSGHDRSDHAAELFLSATLVMGVARDLVLEDRVDHGWLDVLTRTAPSGALPRGVRGGAEVEGVDPTGAAAGVLSPGDVIVSVNGKPVRSVAELRSLVYVLLPGTVVHLRVVHGGRERTVAVTLSSSP